MSKESAPGVFIDGTNGTTGLELRVRLKNLIEKGKINLIQPVKNHRDPESRRKAFLKSNLIVLCLPDEAAIESVAIAGSLSPNAPRILDTSTAHRTNNDWIYGFPELKSEQSGLIRQADLVSNPGCYATGAIALLHPLVHAGLLPQDYPVTINAISGYSGGGKKMIDVYEKGNAPDFELYGLDLEHKHLPEIQTHSKLKRRPVFIPSVGRFYRGMLASIPMNFNDLDPAIKVEDISGVLESHYRDSDLVNVFSHTHEENYRLNPQELAGTDKLNLHVFNNERQNQALLVASLDNLGKGAAGAALQNIHLMLGLKS